MSAPTTQTIRIACRVCNGSGERSTKPRYLGCDRFAYTCSACRGTGVAAERIAPACAEPFPLARPEDDR